MEREGAFSGSREYMGLSGRCNAYGMLMKRVECWQYEELPAFSSVYIVEDHEIKDEVQMKAITTEMLARILEVAGANGIDAYSGNRIVTCPICGVVNHDGNNGKCDECHMAALPKVSVKQSYPFGTCPDCNNDIPAGVADGEACKHCEHVFSTCKPCDDASEHSGD